MKKLGISVYPGWMNDIHETRGYIKQASDLGFKILFTSLHIPEIDYGKALEEFREILKYAGELNFFVMADISPRAFDLLGIRKGDFKKLKEMGIDCIRTDFGYSSDELVAYIENPEGMKIALNASTLTREELFKVLYPLRKRDNLTACHNFYPRRETGLSIELYKERSKPLQEEGIEVFSFVPSRYKRRGPVYEGLPTLELHRDLPAHIGAQHLLTCLGTDGVIVGDIQASEHELHLMSEALNGQITLSVNVCSEVTSEERALIFGRPHTNRLDPGCFCLRSVESRQYATGGREIKPGVLRERKRGCITIDNSKYGRYSGELQVVLADLPPDERVNVVGYIPEGEHFLLDYIGPGTRFCFREGDIIEQK
jgi:hypothetical protein